MNLEGIIDPNLRGDKYQYACNQFRNALMTNSSDRINEW